MLRLAFSPDASGVSLLGVRNKILAELKVTVVVNCFQSRYFGNIFTWRSQHKKIKQEKMIRCELLSVPMLREYLYLAFATFIQSF